MSRTTFIVRHFSHRNVKKPLCATCGRPGSLFRPLVVCVSPEERPRWTHHRCVQSIKLPLGAVLEAI